MVARGRAVLAPIALAVCIDAAGCVAMVESQVSVFHSLPQTIQGTTFAFTPAPEQESSLEFKAYQDQVRAHLVRYGLREVAYADAELAVGFSYQIGDARSQIGSVPVYNAYTGQTMVLNQSHTTYTRRVNLSFADRREFDATGKLGLVYEASVISEGSSAQIAAVMPAMLRALFQKFPGASGETRNVTVPFR